MSLKLYRYGFKIEIADVKCFAENNSKKHISEINENWSNRNISHLAECHLSSNHSVLLRTPSNARVLLDLLIGVKVGDINFY